MATIASLNSKLTLNTSGFRTGIQSAGRNVQRFKRGTADAFRAIGRNYFNLRFMALDALRFIDKLYLDQIDSAAKFADELGITTEALGGYRHAAALTGTDTATLDKGLQRLVRRLGEAKAGYGEGRRGLEALGIDVERIRDLSPEQVLGQVADAIAGVEDPAERAAAAYALFGRQGQDMLNFLNLGSAGLAQTRAEADALGLTFSRLDAAQVEAANDAMTRVKGLVTGIGQQATIAVAPVIESLAMRLLDAGGSGETMGVKVRGAMRIVTAGVAAGANGLKVFELGWLTLRTVAAGVLTYVAESLVGISDAIEAVGGALGFEYQTPQWLKTFEAESSAITDELAAKTAQAFDDLVHNRPAQDVLKYFDELQADATAAAAAIAAIEPAPIVDLDALAAFDQAQQLEEDMRAVEADLDRIEVEPARDLDRRREQTNALLVAGSAQAQLAAFRGGRSDGAEAQMKKQTQLQEQMTDALIRIDRRGRDATNAGTTAASNNWSLV